jgi:hypothetical protein
MFTILINALELLIWSDFFPEYYFFNKMPKETKVVVILLLVTLPTNVPGTSTHSTQQQPSIDILPCSPTSPPDLQPSNPVEFKVWNFISIISIPCVKTSLVNGIWGLWTFTARFLYKSNWSSGNWDLLYYLVSFFALFGYLYRYFSCVSWELCLYQIKINWQQMHSDTCLW